MLSDVHSIPPDGRPLIRPLTHRAIDRESEQLRQELLAVSRCSVEEPGEVALRQHRAGGELPKVEADQAFDGNIEFTHVSRDDLIAALETRFPRGCIATLAATYDANGRVALVAQREVEPNTRILPTLADYGRDRTLAQPRNAPVKGKDHRIDQARLAGTGRPGEGE